MHGRQLQLSLPTTFGANDVAAAVTPTAVVARASAEVTKALGRRPVQPRGTLRRRPEKEK